VAAELARSRLEVRYRLLGFAQLEQRHSQQLLRIGIVRSQAQRALVSVSGSGDIALVMGAQAGFDKGVDRRKRHLPNLTH
jgi:hypothetical protein